MNHKKWGLYPHPKLLDLFKVHGYLPENISDIFRKNFDKLIPLIDRKSLPP